jgi:O-antigen ligase
MSVGMVTLPVGLLLTYSRSAYIAFAAVIVSQLILAPRIILGLLTRSVVALGAAFLLFGHSYLPVAEKMISRRRQIDQRLEIFAHAAQMFGDNPILGDGLGAHLIKHGLVVHNTFLWTFAEMGLLGALSFHGMLIAVLVAGLAVIRRLRHTESAGARLRLAQCAVASHVAMLGLAIGIEALYQRSWWLVIGVISALACQVHREGRTPQRPLGVER